MRIIKETSPYIHKKADTKRMMFDCILALLPILIFAVIQFGFAALKIIITSSFIMVLSELVFVFLTATKETKVNFKTKFQNFKNKLTINNIITPLISAFIFSLLLPSGVSLYIIITGSLFGIIIGKLVFGGLGSNIFNPACLGFIFATICFGESFSYPVPNFSSEIDVLIGGTPLNNIVTTKDAFKDLFFGFVRGSIGEVSKFLIIIGGIYLLIKRSSDFRPVVASILAFCFFMFIAGLVNKSNPFTFMLYQLLAGGFLFGAFFMITDPVTSPITGPGRIIYGVLVASITVIIRFFGGFNEGMAFAILICNMFVPMIDSKVRSKYSYKHIIVLTSIIVIISGILIFGL